MTTMTISKSFVAPTFTGSASDLAESRNIAPPPTPTPRARPAPTVTKSEAMFVPTGQRSPSDPEWSP
jgi:hypothetical protein